MPLRLKIAVHDAETRKWRFLTPVFHHEQDARAVASQVPLPTVVVELDCRDWPTAVYRATRSTAIDVIEDLMSAGEILH